MQCQYKRTLFIFELNHFSKPVGHFSSLTPLSLVCLWYLPIPEPQKGWVVEEYQHWLHINLIDSLPNSYSIFFPSGVPSVSFPLPLLNFLNSLFNSHSAFFCPCFPSYTLSPLLSSPAPFFLSLTAIFPPVQKLTRPLSLPLSTSCLFFSPHPVLSGSRKSVWSAEHSCWTPAGQKCQPPLLEQLVHGTPP